MCQISELFRWPYNIINIMGYGLVVKISDNNITLFHNNPEIIKSGLELFIQCLQNYSFEILLCLNTIS